ncbi:MAG: hypothetical protein ACTSU5_00680 [Promethearchaeota archaeon]
MASPNYDESLKQDLVPVIASILGTDPAPLFDLPVDVLNKLLEVASSGSLPAERLREILDSTKDPAEIAGAIDGQLSSAPSPYQYDEAADLRAGILALVPDPSDREKIAAKIAEIDDVSRLNFLASLPDYQIKVELGLTPLTSGPAPGMALPPTASQSGQAAHGSPGAPESSSQGDLTEGSPATSASTLADERDARAKEVADQIIDHCRKKHLEANVGEWVDILETIHPDDLTRILHLIKKVKDSKKLLAFMDWVVVTHQIEQIDVDVQHWQGVRVQDGVGAVGGYSAGIPFRRYDKAVVQLPTGKIAQFAAEGSAVLIELKSSDIGTFRQGAKDAKEFATLVQRTIMR